MLRRGSEEQADVGGLLANKSHCDVQAWAVAKGRVWVHGPNAVTVVCLDVHWFLLPLRGLRMPRV